MGITTEAEANQRIAEFTAKYGNGKVGLTEIQKKARMEKVLGADAEKVKALGENKSEGVEINTKYESIISDDNEGYVDGIPQEVIEKINDYPREYGIDDHRIIFMEVKESGEINYEGIIINGKEGDSKERCMFGVNVLDDEISAKNESKQFQNGKLKEVSDRTMAIHQENNNLKPLLDDPEMDTDPDKQWQI